MLYNPHKCKRNKITEKKENKPNVYIIICNVIKNTLNMLYTTVSFIINSTFGVTLYLMVARKEFLKLDMCLNGRSSIWIVILSNSPQKCDCCCEMPNDIYILHITCTNTVRNTFFILTFEIFCLTKRRLGIETL